MIEIIRKNRYNYYINYMVKFTELFILNALFAVQLFFFKNYLNDSIVNLHSVLFLLLNAAYLPTLLLRVRKFQNCRIYSLSLLFFNALKVSLILFVCFSALLTLSKIYGLSRIFILSFSIEFFLLLFLLWCTVSYLLGIYRKSGYNFKKILLVGSGNSVLNLYNELTYEQSYGYKVLGIFLEREPESELPEGLEILGYKEDLFNYLSVNEVDELYSVMENTDEEQVNRMIKFCDMNLIRFYYMLPLADKLYSKATLCMVGDYPMMTLRREPLHNPISRFVKRGFDFLFSFIVLIFSPLWLLPIAFLVKLSSPGPIFFKQRRTGENGHQFYCYKFRSMEVNDNCDIMQASKNDVRTTKIGSFLRKSNLDELPQLYNVFKGEMSLVGPRPHMLKHTEDYSKVINKYMVRHYIKPGLTGWAQVNGYRGETKEDWQMQKRIDFDLWYIENWSFSLDVKIIGTTIYQMLSRQNKNAF